MGKRPRERKCTGTVSYLAETRELCWDHQEAGYACSQRIQVVPLVRNTHQCSGTGTQIGQLSPQQPKQPGPLHQARRSAMHPVHSRPSRSMTASSSAAPFFQFQKRLSKLAVGGPDHIVVLQEAKIAKTWCRGCQKMIVDVATVSCVTHTKRKQTSHCKRLCYTRSLNCKRRACG